MTSEVADVPRAGGRFRTALPAAPIVGLIAAIALVALLHAPRATFSYYDEGVYYYQSVLLAQGERPYADFAVPQPPGILAVGAASKLTGVGLPGVRLASWACGMVALYQTFWLARLVAGRCRSDNPALVGVTAAALVAVSNRTVCALTSGATELFALCLGLAAAQLVLVGVPRRAWLPGVVLGLATLFRLQPASYLPGFLALMVAVHGPRAAIRPFLLFSFGFGLTAAACHGALSALVTNYVDCVFAFQLERTRMTFSEKVLGLLQFLSETHVGFAVVSTACLAAGRSPAGRGVGWYAAVMLVVTTFSGTVLNLLYYVPVLPFLMTAAALVVDAAGRAFGGRAVFVAAVAVAAGGTAFQNKAELLDQRRPDAAHREFLGRLRAAPGGTVWTLDGRVAELAGKRLVADYYATDPNMLFARRRELFRAWMRETAPRADVVAVTALVVTWLTPDDARFLAGAGKELLFESEDTERSYRALLSR